MEPHRSILINSPVCYEATYLVGNNADARLGFAQAIGIRSRIVHVIVYALPGHKAYYGLATGNDLKSNSHVIAIPYPSLVGIVFDHLLDTVLMEMSGHFTTSCGKSRGTWRQRQVGQVVPPAYPMAGHRQSYGANFCAPWQRRLLSSRRGAGVFPFPSALFIRWPETSASLPEVQDRLAGP